MYCLDQNRNFSAGRLRKKANVLWSFAVFAVEAPFGGRTQCAPRRYGRGRGGARLHRALLHVRCAHWGRSCFFSSPGWGERFSYWTENLLGSPEIVKEYTDTDTDTDTDNDDNKTANKRTDTNDIKNKKQNKNTKKTTNKNTNKNNNETENTNT